MVGLLFYHLTIHLIIRYVKPQPAPLQQRHDPCGGSCCPRRHFQLSEGKPVRCFASLVDDGPTELKWQLSVSLERSLILGRFLPNLSVFDSRGKKPAKRKLPTKRRDSTPAFPHFYFCWKTIASP